MRLTVRLITFALSLLLGVAAWYAFARAQSLATPNSHANGNMNRNVNGSLHADAGVPMNGSLVFANTNAMSHAEEVRPDGESRAAEAEPPSVGWGELKPLWGYANVQRITLRSRPDASAPAVAGLELTEYDAAEILDSTRDYLRVRFPPTEAEDGTARRRDYEGWVEWGAVQPHASAIVLDAESGEVVGRLPLHPGLTSFAYAPGGKRALFYGPVLAGGHDEGAALAFEVDAESYKVVRTLETSATGGFAALAYDDSGEVINALAQTINYHEQGYDSRLHSFRIKGDQVESPDAGLTHHLSGNLILAPDGLTGLFVHKTGWAADRTRMDVVDLRTMEVRSSVEVEGVGGGWWPTEYAVSRDGSELYFKDPSGEGKIVVVNTRSGKRVREIPLRVPENHWPAFTQESLVGDSILLRLWRVDAEGEGRAQSFWLKEGGETIAAERGIDYAVEAGGTRYAVNESGTRLFKLDGDNRITARYKIERPEAKHRPNVADGLTVLGLSASPDGKHIILILGMVDGC